ncbi:MAG TPA: hypothetical protein VM509_02120, partial [Planctomycetota bacterium]|nr:hypothetical protein [Planctomycetota bacterium]
MKRAHVVWIALALVLAAVVAFEFLRGGRAEHVELDTRRPSAMEPATEPAELETPAPAVVANETDRRVEAAGTRALVHVV